jgi:hypothetical protein
VKLKKGMKIYNDVSTVPFVIGLVVPGGAYCHVLDVPNPVTFVPESAMRFEPPVVVDSATAYRPKGGAA